MSKDPFDDIPEYEPIEGGGGRGPGIEADDLDDIKTDQITDLPLAVMGFLIFPSQYEPTTPLKEGEKNEFAVIHIKFKNGDQYVWRTSGRAILRKLEHRWKADQIPFRTMIINVPNKRGTFEYLDFTN